MNFSCLWIFVGEVFIVQYEMTLDWEAWLWYREMGLWGKGQVRVPALSLTRYLASWGLVALPYPTYSTGLQQGQLGETLGKLV